MRPGSIRYFAEWAYWAPGKEMVEAIRADHSRQAARKARVGVSRQLQPVVNFYRVAWRLLWMDPVYRDNPGAAPYDYYMLMNGDAALVEQLRLRTLMRDGLSGAVLAKTCRMKAQATACFIMEGGSSVFQEVF